MTKTEEEELVQTLREWLATMGRSVPPEPPSSPCPWLPEVRPVVLPEPPEPTFVERRDRAYAEREKRKQDARRARYRERVTHKSWVQSPGPAFDGKGYDPTVHCWCDVPEDPEEDERVARWAAAVASGAVPMYGKR